MSVNITFLSPSNDLTFFTVENASAAGQAGGIGAVVKAIKTRISNPGVCFQGCGALMIMTLNGKEHFTYTMNSNKKR